MNIKRTRTLLAGAVAAAALLCLIAAPAPPAQAAIENVANFQHLWAPGHANNPSSTLLMKWGCGNFLQSQWDQIPGASSCAELNGQPFTVYQSEWASLDGNHIYLEAVGGEYFRLWLAFDGSTFSGPLVPTQAELDTIFTDEPLRLSGTAAGGLLVGHVDLPGGEPVPDPEVSAVAPMSHLWDASHVTNQTNGTGTTLLMKWGCNGFLQPQWDLIPGANSCADLNGKPFTIIDTGWESLIGQFVYLQATAQSEWFIMWANYDGATFSGELGPTQLELDTIMTSEPGRLSGSGPPAAGGLVPGHVQLPPPDPVPNCKSNLDCDDGVYCTTDTCGLDIPIDAGFFQHIWDKSHATNQATGGGLTLMIKTPCSNCASLVGVPLTIVGSLWTSLNGAHVYMENSSTGNAQWFNVWSSFNGASYSGSIGPTAQELATISSDGDTGRISGPGAGGVASGHIFLGEVQPDGCVFTPNTLACDDGDICTDNDACYGGSCQPGPPLDCSDGDPCTDDLCESPSAGCYWEFNTGPCPDGLVCNGDETCDGAGNCLPGTALDCDPLDTECADYYCSEAASGCTSDAINEGADCDGEDLCTVGQTCVAGSCVGGTTGLFGDACDWIMVGGGDRRVRSKLLLTSQTLGDICMDRGFVGWEATVGGTVVATEDNPRRSNSIRFGPGAVVEGDILTGGAGVLGVPHFTPLPGNVGVDALDGGSTLAKEPAGTSYDLTGADPLVGTCNDAQDALAVAQAALEPDALPATESLGSFVVRAGDSYTFEGTNPGGLNVFEFRNFKCAAGATVIIDAMGDPSNVFVFRADNKILTKVGTNIVLQNGAKPGNVLFYARRGKIEIGYENSGAGTLFSPNGAVKVQGKTTWAGAVHGGRSPVFVGLETVLSYEPFRAF